MLVFFFATSCRPAPPPPSSQRREPPPLNLGHLWWTVKARDYAPSNFEVVSVARSRTEALSLTDIGRPSDPFDPSATVFDEIDFDSFMLAFIGRLGFLGDEFDFESVERSSREILIHAVLEKNPAPDTSVTVLFSHAIAIPASPLPVRIEWTEGAIAEMRMRRDCQGGHSPPAGSTGCAKCGAGTVSAQASLCDRCAELLNLCPICGKRVGHPFKPGSAK